MHGVCMPYHTRTPSRHTWTQQPHANSQSQARSYYRGQSNRYHASPRANSTRTTRDNPKISRFSHKDLVARSIQRRGWIRVPIRQGRLTIMPTGFTGTQHGLTVAQHATLTQVLSYARPTDFHHGDCIGADAAAHVIAIRAGHQVIIHPPKDAKKRAFCKGHFECEPRDYILRNHDIVNSTQTLIACPKSFHEERRSGTWATIRAALKIGKPVTLIVPSGLIRTLHTTADLHLCP